MFVRVGKQENIRVNMAILKCFSNNIMFLVFPGLELATDIQVIQTLL